MDSFLKQINGFIDSIKRNKYRKYVFTYILVFLSIFTSFSFSFFQPLYDITLNINFMKKITDNVDIIFYLYTLFIRK